MRSETLFLSLFYVAPFLVLLAVAKWSPVEFLVRTDV